MKVITRTFKVSSFLILLHSTAQSFTFSGLPTRLHREAGTRAISWAADEDPTPFKVHGLSVSETGFVALLRDAKSGSCLALPVDNEQGTASTPEALTLLQLFQGIDLMGWRLPPDILTVRYAEHTDIELKYSGKVTSYTAASDWLRARCSEQLPCVELLRVTVRAGPDGSGEGTAVELLCARTTSDSLATVEVRCPNIFEGVALSLRYKVSIAVDASLADGIFHEDEIPKRLPLWRSVADAAAQEARITSTFKKTVESTKLDAALKVARERGDVESEKKIRAAMRKLDHAAAAEIPTSDGGEDGLVNSSTLPAATEGANDPVVASDAPLAGDCHSDETRKVDTESETCPDNEPKDP